MDAEARGVQDADIRRGHSCAPGGRESNGEQEVEETRYQGLLHTDALQ